MYRYRQVNAVVFACVLTLAPLSVTTLALAQDQVQSQVQAEMRFSDTKGHWAEQVIARMVQRGIINGVDSTHFIPENHVTRAEFAKMLVLTVGEPKAHETASYQDVQKDDWFFNYVETARDWGIMNDQPSAFQPNKPITREEAAAWITKVLPALNTGVAGGQTSPYTDLEQSSAATKANAQRLYDLGIMFGYEGKFRPDGLLTRAEAAVLLDRVYQRLSTVTWSGDVMFKHVQSPPVGMRDWVQQHRATRGIHRIEFDGHTYILIGRGQKANSGYGVDVTKVTSANGKITVTIEVRNPKPGEMYAQVITYPYVLIQIPQTSQTVELDSTSESQL